MPADLVPGQRFGRLTILEVGLRLPQKDRTRAGVRVRCDCGVEKVLFAQHLLAKSSVQSCGCLIKDVQRTRCLQRNTTHGDSKTRLYRIWRGAKTRALNPNYPQAKDYSGRGIGMCLEWLDSFETFEEWALSFGYAAHLTLDRIDNDKGYEPENCRWITRAEQNMNKRVPNGYSVEGYQQRGSRDARTGGKHDVRE